MAIYADEEKIMSALNAEMERQVKLGLEQVIEDAKKKLEETLRAELAQIVMSMHKYYRVDIQEKRIVITVENRT